MFPRRSPRLQLGKMKTVTSGKHFGNSYSTSMLDLNLLGAQKPPMGPPPVLRGKRVKSYTSIVGNIQNKLKREPKDKQFITQENTLEKQSRGLKRMRDSTLTLRSLDNVMPSPVKRVKSCQAKITSGISLNSKSKHVSQAKHSPLKRVQSCGAGKIPDTTLDSKGDPLKKKLTKVISFARGFSPRRSGRKKSEEKEIIIKRSSSLRAVQPPRSPDPSLSSHFPVRTRTRGSQLWLESVADLDEVDCWTPQQIKRQEAIYELYCGESDLVEDINLIQEVYINPLSEQKLLREEDLASIFGSIQSLLPLHADLVKKLEAVRSENGSINEIGEILLKWIPTLQPYIIYCAKQLEIKEILFHISKDKQVSDFFQRCLEAPCSRKLDLWSFLDSPRSKLVKYPLLVTNIHKYTPKDHPDRTVLEKSVKELESLITEADRETGISKCLFYKEKLNFTEDEQYRKAFDKASMLVCNGCLKNKAGSKIYGFLFNTIFVCARTTTRNGNKVYIVNTKPILVADMFVTDLGDGEVRLGGSFRTTLSKGSAARHAFRISSHSPENGGKSIILQASDQHDKKQWLNAFQSLLGKAATKTYRNDSIHQLKPTESNEDVNHLTIDSASSSRSNSTSEITCIS